MAHCNGCCLRLSLTKTKLLPEHYSAATHGWWSYGPQKECPCSATSRYTADRDLYGAAADLAVASDVLAADAC